MEREREVEDGEYPFRDLVICVTGISKEERKKVKEGTESLGGSYSPNLHPNCTHLLVSLSPYGFPGPKLQHALAHPSAFRNPLFVVTLRWILDCVTTCSRLHESPYSLHTSYSASRCDSCFPASLKLPPEQITRPNSEAYIQDIKQSHQQPHLVYIDSDVSAQLHTKVVDVVVQEGGMLANQWFVGCGADYVVCEGSSIQKYLRHCDNIVSPIWFLKTSKERSMQRFVGMSADLAREAGLMLENFQRVTAEQETEEENHCKIFTGDQSRISQAERLKIVKLAKSGIRNRRARRLQSCEVPLRPNNSSSLLDSICWSISEPTSTVTVYEESISSKNTCDIQKNILIDGQERVESDLSFSNLLRPLTESERSELIFRNHFLTILFPVDRFAEMGPSSRTYFSDSGFMCLQLLDFIYDFYQESMSEYEIRAAIHTDSRHAELLRSRYCSDRGQIGGDMVYKRILFMGSRKSFEKLKRVSGDNNSNVYELLIRE